MNKRIKRPSISDCIRGLLARPFFILLGGTGIAQLITFAGAPFLTRLYSPEAFGLLALFGTSLSVVGAIAAGRYEQAVIGETVNEYADALVLLVTGLSICFAAFLPFLIPILLPILGAPTSIYGISGYLVPAVVAYTTGQALMSWIIRKGGFHVTSVGKILQAIAVLCTSLLLVGSSIGLVVASMTGYVVSCLALAFGAQRMGWLQHSVKIKDQIFLLRRHIKFPLLGIFPALFDTVSMLLPVYSVALYFGPTDTGQFGLMRQVLAAPLGMISMIVTQLLMKRLVDVVASQASMLPILRRVLLFVCWPVLALGGAIFLFGQDLFAWIFGEIWRQAGGLSRWMVWAYIAAMIVSPLSSVLLVLRKIGSNGAWQLMHSIGVLIIVASGSFTSIEQFVKVLMIFELVSYGIYAVLIGYVIYIYEKLKGTQLNFST